jgi:oxepin-CoA hydrolase / 3-oxo-5,6-dehydrosuberyl-CoA semialdehyde dehydrogenase
MSPGEPFVKGSNIPKGIVKWYVEILDETQDPLIGVATILTMVAKR